MSVRVCSVVGARPQFIKAGAVSRAFGRLDSVENVLVHTGQHYDANMSEVFFREFGLAAPRYNLEVGSASHAKQTARMLEKLEDVFVAEKPDVVLIYGDTNSTLAAAIVASKLNVPVAHVEAGLRSFNRRMPEEVNRLVADAVSDVLFAPTVEAVAQLRLEGHRESRIVWSGDVMYDAALMTADLARTKSTILHELGLNDRGYYLATVHRAENTDDPTRLRSIVEALSQVAARVPVVLPLHPRTRAALEREGLIAGLPPAIRVIDPVGFIDMVRLEMGALAIASDSGGVQKEAFFYRVPCFVLRDETEWVELIHAGWNTLVPPTDGTEMARVMLALNGRNPQEINPYGDGNAAGIIVDTLIQRYGT